MSKIRGMNFQNCSYSSDVLGLFLYVLSLRKHACATLARLISKTSRRKSSGDFTLIGRLRKDTSGKSFTLEVTKV
mgnify:CR=1 FL=1